MISDLRFEGVGNHFRVQFQRHYPFDFQNIRLQRHENQGRLNRASYRPPCLPLVQNGAGEFIY